MSDDTKPRFRVYSLIPRERDSDFWLNLGVAFPHKDGKGFNLSLQALPLGGKLIIREVEDETEPEPPAPRKKRAADAQS